MAGIPEGEFIEPKSIWQSPLVLNVMPFVTSLAMHVGVLVLIVVVVKLPDMLAAIQPDTTQVIIPTGVDTGLAKESTPLQFPRDGDDPSRRRMQDQFPEFKDAQGFSDVKSTSLRQVLTGGSLGDTDQAGISMIAIGPLGGSGRGWGTGKGDGKGPGTGPEGATAPFGPVGGGHPSVINFGGVPDHANRIVYLCDASGTMTTIFDDLRVEMRRSIGKLLVIQSFNIVFFSGDEVIMLEKNGLLPATAANKAKAYDFLDGMSARSTTDPIPAIKAAFAGGPELIYCLTDGFDAVESFESVAEAFRAGNRDGKVKVNTLLIENSDQPQLRAIMEKIAKENRGQFRRLTADDFNRN